MPPAQCLHQRGVCLLHTGRPSSWRLETRLVPIVCVAPTFPAEWPLLPPPWEGSLVPTSGSRMGTGCRGRGSGASGLHFGRDAWDSQWRWQVGGAQGERAGVAMQGSATLQSPGSRDSQELCVTGCLLPGDRVTTRHDDAVGKWECRALSFRSATAGYSAGSGGPLDGQGSSS